MPIHKIDNKLFRLERDVIEVTPISKPDDDWEFTDKSGHLHRWQNGKLPSLKQIVDSPATEEYPASFHFECKRCGESINPGYKSPEYREYEPSLTHFYIDDIQVTKEEFETEYQTASLKLSS
uniref:Uncharacterized protein n=1 Tax=viral metagenome TaxID=1070528 RepID=A0A6M3KSJ1_9ZZZZ